MSDLEKRMSAMLEGKFFYDPTHRNFKSERPIVVPKPKPKPKEPEKPKVVAVENKPFTAFKFELLVKAVCWVHKVEPKELLSDSRRNKVCAARAHLIWELWERTGYSSLKIGMLLKRDHSTVLHNLSKFENTLLKNGSLILAVREFYPKK